MAMIKEDEHLVDSQLLLDKIPESIVNGGVIHIGAHTGEEVELYFSKGFDKVVLIEANPDTFEILLSNFQNDSRVKCFNCAIGEKTESLTFNVYKSRTDNTESSSILPFEEFDKIVPSLELKKKIPIDAYSLLDFINVNELDLNDYSMLVLDIQGADYLVLKGANQLLLQFNSIITEINYLNLYKDSKNDDKIKNLLLSLGFKLEEEVTHTLYQGSKTFPAWGEGLFLKNNE